MLLDGGNLISPAKKYPGLYAELYLRAFNLMGYDAMNIGPLDLRYGISMIKHLETLADFPLLSADMRSKGTVSQPFIVKDMGEVKVAVIGSIGDPSMITDAPMNLEPIATVIKELVDRLRKQADMVVLMTHMPHDQARVLIQSVGNIDLVLLGNIKQEIVGEMVGTTMMVGPGEKGEMSRSSTSPGIRSKWSSPV